MTRLLDAPAGGPKRVLDPSERTAEVLFGLIMVLTFTGSLSAAEAGRDDIRAMLIGALGCNIAWGIIDGVLYLMGALGERGSNLRVYRAVRGADDSAGARQLISDALPAPIAAVLDPLDFDRIDQRLKQLPEPPMRPRLSGSDWRGALGVFLLVFSSTFPVAIPFIVMQNAASAMRASNAIAVTMMFVAGVAYGRAVGWSQWAVGLSMVALGSVLVAMTIALGG
jgi:VIT1/CCC1 family predicted Fe2+/Mn2+ transporter